MLSTAWLVTRVELRRRWASLLGVALLVALVSAVVLTALVGAHRTSTTIDRFREATGASDASFQSDTLQMSDEMLGTVRRLPEVEVATSRYLVNAFPVDGTPDIAVMSDPDGIYGVGIDAAELLDGRLPDPEAPDELLLNELASQVTGLGVGDRVRARSWSADDLEALFGDRFPGFNGPELDLEVVGVGRMPEELPGDVRRTGPFAIASSSFLPAHPGVGAWPPAVLVRLRHGAEDIDAVAAALASRHAREDAGDGPGGFYPSATTAADVYLDTSQRTVDSLATGLLVLALGAAAAGAIAVGQAVTRQLSAAATPSASLEALGMSRSEAAGVRSVPIALAGVVGVLVGGAAAVAASPLLPTGLARRAEVDPGVWIDPTVLAGGLALLVLLVAVWSFVSARVRRAGSPSTARTHGGSPAARAVGRAGAPPVIVTGVRLAAERGRGTGAISLRSALVGVAIGVAGILAAGVIGASTTDLTNHPDRWGWTWSTMPDYFGDGDVSDLARRLVDDDRITAVGESSVDSIVLAGEPLVAYALQSMKGSIAQTLTAGRLPSGAGEVALGRRTMDRLGVDLGDTIVVETIDGSTIPLLLVGTVVLPPTDEYRLDVGAVLTPEGLEAVGSEDRTSSLVLRYPPGADAAELEAALGVDYGLEFGPFTKGQTPGAIRNLADSRNIAVALAAFFTALAALGLVHALQVSTRRRRGDLAVLRTLGFRRSQVRRAILTQSLVLGLVGVALGVPAGLIAGRLVWRQLVGGIGAVADPTMPWPVVFVVAPSVALLAAFVAWWPGRAAVRTPPAAQLRAG